MEILLIRHAPAIRQSGLLYGQSDLDVDLSNENLFREVASKIPHNSGIITSHLKRCSKTARKLMSYRKDLNFIREDPLCSEQDFGDFELVERADVEILSDCSYWLFPPEFRPPNGESFDDLKARSLSFFKDLLTVELDNLAIVTHGNFIRATVSNVLSLSGNTPANISVRNLGIIRLKIAQSDSRIEMKLQFD